MSDQGLTAADRLRGLAVQPEVESLPFICGRDDIEDAADAVEACDGVAYEDLSYLAARGGLAALLEAARKAEAQFRWYGDLHAAKPDPEKAKRNYECADMLAALLPPVGESETATDHANVSPPPDAEAEALGYPNPGVESEDVSAAERDRVVRALRSIALDARRFSGNASYVSATDMRMAFDHLADVASRQADALSKREVEG